MSAAFRAADCFLERFSTKLLTSTCIAAAVITSLEVMAKRRSGKWIWEYWMENEQLFRTITAPGPAQVKEYHHKMALRRAVKNEKAYWSKVAELGLPDSSQS
uniref:Uncharacterized protein n=1 Tax=Eutreptiella gymnastica TaxID=73025 RepID=A0A7S4FMY0_9EUGL